MGEKKPPLVMWPKMQNWATNLQKVWAKKNRLWGG